jgi:hypothetical protein
MIDRKEGMHETAKAQKYQISQNSKKIYDVIAEKERDL